MKFLMHAFFVILILLVTFFGLGPILFADGVMMERIWTAVVVGLIYALLTFLYSRASRWSNKK